MKKNTILLILAIPVLTFSQINHLSKDFPTIQQGNDTSKIRFKPKTYKTRISLTNAPKRLKGCLYQLNDSSMAVVTDKFLKQGFQGETESVVLKIDQVNMIKVRRKGNVLKVAVIGALSGLAIGVIWGIAEGGSKDTPMSRLLGHGWGFATAGERASVCGAMCMIPAAAIGAIIGSISIEIPINGSQGTYEKNRKKLERYSVK